MSEDLRPNDDPLEAAIQAFQLMTVPERPPDTEVLARRGDWSRSADTSNPPRWRDCLRFFAPAAAAAVLLLVGVALYLRNDAAPTSDQAAVTDPPVDAGNPAGPPALLNAVPAVAKSRPLGRKTLERSVAEAQVIVVATALGPDPAAPVVPGNPPENRILFQVNRVLKGQLAAQVIVIQTPTAANEFVGKQWIVMLSPDYVAGNSSYAGCSSIAMEADVKAILGKGK